MGTVSLTLGLRSVRAERGKEDAFAEGGQCICKVFRGVPRTWIIGVREMSLEKAI